MSLAPPSMLMRRFVLAGALVLGASGCTPQPERTFDPPPTVLYLLRHAETGEGRDPGLSDEGQARAEALAALLVDRRIAAIYTSQFARTQATAQPLADTLGLDVGVRPLDTADPRGSAALAVREIAAAHFPQQIVIVGHSNTIPAMIEALTDTPMADLAHDAYDDLFVVTITEHPDQRTPDDITVEQQRFGTP
ncbi:MAG: phosphoglycerate mutase family protein [Bacteroidota bacterium]